MLAGDSAADVRALLMPWGREISRSDRLAEAFQRMEVL
jgi:hypothetical protein